MIITSSTPSDHSAGWAFVLARSQQIDRLATRFFRGLATDDRPDARNDYIARVVEQYPRLRLEGALNAEMVIVTWLGWQARAVAQQYHRRARKHEYRRDDRVLVQIGAPAGEDGPRCRELAAEDGENTPEGVERPVVEADAQQLVEELYALATPKQREAMLSMLLEMAPVEMRGRYGLAPNARNERLYDLRARATRQGLARSAC